MKEKLKEERKQIEELWKTKTELEDERRLQDRAVEQLQRKVGPEHSLGAVGLNKSNETEFCHLICETSSSRVTCEHSFSPSLGS